MTRKTRWIGASVWVATALCLLWASPRASSAGTVDDMGLRATVARISSGPSTSNHACAVKADGTVRCWGANGNGQLGDGTTTNRTLPVSVGGVKEAVGMAAGDSHSCALLASGGARCWGANASGQIGDGSTIQRPKAVAVSGLASAVNLAAGGSHTCAVLADGTARCWGENANGQLGNGGDKSQPAPVAVTGLVDTVALAGGVLHTCALAADGSVRCWGDNSFGQLGDGTTAPRLTPGPAVALGGAAVAVTAGRLFTCALLTDGTARCWGFNDTGQLGDGTLEQRNSPVPVSGLTGATSIDAGTRFVCARRGDGTVVCWGRNAAGQLGDGTTIDRPTPVTTVGLTNVVAVSGGNTFACALQANDTARCWGDNSLGQLGNGTTSGSTVAQVVGGGGGTISGRGLAAGQASQFTCARRADATLTCWGSNSAGQLGGSIGGNRLLPTAVAGLTDVAGVTGGAGFTCALKADGAVSCWGANALGQLGDGTTTQRGQPAPVVGLSGPATDVSAGNAFACAALQDRTAQCWGSNSSGQLGDGTTLNSPAPVAVAGLDDAVGLATGASHVCALLGSGGVLCWGSNSSGQLGDGSTTPRPAPVPVVGLSGAVALAAGLGHTCALLDDGTARCWGKNDQGQLGIGITGDITIPVSPLDLTSAVAIATGGDHTCARLASGQVRCWGDNGVNQVSHLAGDQLSPVTVVLPSLQPLQSVVALAAGDHHSCALQSNGSPYCWGNNSAGEVGNGTTTSGPFPTEVPSFRFNIAPSVELTGRGRVARVTALMNCPEGAQVKVRISVTQGPAAGAGNGLGKCTGALEAYPVTVPARGRHRFEPGPAVAEAEADVRSRGTLVETQEWTRGVQMVVEP